MRDPDPIATSLLIVLVIVIFCAAFIMWAA